MVDLGAKIKKKVYKFDLKKRYQSISHYKIKERPPIEKIKDAIKKLTAPKKQEKKEETFTSAPPKGGFNFAVFGAFILIAIIILALAFLYFSSQFIPSGGPFQAPVDKPVINNTIEGGQILTTGLRGTPEYIAAVLVDYNTSNINNYSVVISTYDKKLPSEVFVLNSERFEASTYSDFIRTLRANLEKRKIILNEISIKQLETLPQGALVIVPSGVIPKEFLGFDSQITMSSLLDRGIVVLYIGQPFNRMFNGSLVVTTPQTTVNSLPVRFDQTSELVSSDGFHLFQPLYRASSGSTDSGLVYGSVSYAARGNGAFVFVPQTLDGGWRSNHTAAAEDIARIVFESPWAKPNAPNATYNFTNQAEFSGNRYFFSQPFKSPNATAKVEFIGYSNSSNFPVRETLIIQLEKNDQNALFIDLGGRVVPTNITNLPVRMNAELNEPVAAQPSMLLVITDVNGTELQTFPQGSVDVQSDKSFDIQVFVDRGEYIVKLVDDESKTHAQTYMKVVSPEITYIGFENQRKSAYLFDIKMEGNPFELQEVNVKVDGGQYGTYTFNNVQRMRVDVGQFTGGENMPLGNHSFEFTSGGLHLKVPVDHFRAKTIFDEPFFWIVMILTGGIVGVGMFFARQEEVYYALDIPDFPPVAKTRIPLAADAVLGIFQKVNDTYRWQNTPLTSAEIKNGFKDIFVKGKPIYITDYNVEFLLEELEKRGQVRESLSYYGLTEWEAKSKRSIEYLSLMRRIRDICVNNAIPFTSIGESKEADTVITVVGQQISVHFYEKNANLRELISRVLPTIGRGISIILFKNPFDKDGFQQLVNSSPSVAPLIVKMEADSSSLLFLTTEELEKMLLEFKSM